MPRRNFDEIFPLTKGGKKAEPSGVVVDGRPTGQPLALCAAPFVKGEYALRRPARAGRRARPNSSFAYLISRRRW
jgi:hypothetical protein